VTAASNDESVVLALEELLSAGTARGLADGGWAALSKVLAATGDPELPDLLMRIRDGGEPPEAILRALDAHRRRFVAGLTPPSLPRGLAARDRDRWLAGLNALAGAPAPAAADAERLMDLLAVLPAPLVAAPIERTSDVATLWCLVRTGRTAERRAAVERLGALIGSGKIKGEGFSERQLVAGLAEMRDPRVAYEVDNALSRLPGSAGRGARHRLARADRLLARVEEAARRFWTGDEETDPLHKLVREESLRLGMWLRRGSDVLASHVAEHLKSLLGRAAPAQLVDAVGALIPSGDARLLPVLGRILPDGPIQARVATARALARIADPRVHPALVKAFRHATDRLEKVVIAGALGQYGDRQALPFLLEVLGDSEPALGEETLRSLGDLGAPEAAPRLLPFLDGERAAIARASAQALVRCGGSDALDALRDRTRLRHPHATALGEAADALALRLRISGLIEDGERRVFVAPVRESDGADAPLAPARPRPPVWAWARAAVLLLLGLVWAFLLQRERAISALAASARLDPRAPAPHVRAAAIHAASGRDDLAVEAFRRALAADRAALTGRSAWVTRLCNAYVRHADDLVSEGQRRRALEVLDELAPLDLGEASVDLRLAIARRRDALLSGAARKRAAGP
jgi:HEAT repeat protein